MTPAASNVISIREGTVVPMNRQRLIIVGAGAHGAEVYAYIQDVVGRGGVGEVLGYLDDDPARKCAETRVIGDLKAFVDRPAVFFRDLRYLTALGDNATRRDVVAALQRTYGNQMTPWTLVHPTSYIGEEVEIGPGTCLAPAAIVTCRTRIGKHCILNVKASVSHDCRVGDFVNLNPGVTVCGNVTIGDEAYIGAGATIIDKVSIGAGAIVGAGAVVIDNVPPNVTVVGVPARIVKHNLVTV